MGKKPFEIKLLTVGRTEAYSVDEVKDILTDDYPECLRRILGSDSDFSLKVDIHETSEVSSFFYNARNIDDVIGVIVAGLYDEFIDALEKSIKNTGKEMYALSTVRKGLFSSSERCQTLAAKYKIEIDDLINKYAKRAKWSEDYEYFVLFKKSFDELTPELQEPFYKRARWLISLMGKNFLIENIERDIQEPLQQKGEYKEGQIGG